MSHIDQLVQRTISAQSTAIVSPSANDLFIVQFMGAIKAHKFRGLVLVLRVEEIVILKRECLATYLLLIEAFLSVIVKVIVFLSYSNDTAKVIPTSDLSTSSNGKRPTPRVTTTSLHPFTRLDEASDMDRQWNVAIPLNNVS